MAARPNFTIGGWLKTQFIRRSVFGSEVNVAVWPIATKFSLGLYVSFWSEAEVGRTAEFAASVENDPFRTFL
jgi:hypothetical protein